ncbi:MAG: YfcE family phosphodiesterase [Calditerrivibrio sp.]|nr:YfcE family phosphodiesterase [Calditerrivibrio sp.]
MQVLIISDTHVDSIQKLPPVLISLFPSCDAVIHAGDIVGLNTYEEMKKLNPKLYAVAGNMDASYGVLEHTLRIDLGQMRIGITHGHIYTNLYNGLMYDFNDCNMVIFGHTHSPYFRKENNLWLLNPGSTFKNRWKTKNSYAILKIYNNDFRVTFYDI